MIRYGNKQAKEFLPRVITKLRSLKNKALTDYVQLSVWLSALPAAIIPQLGIRYGGVFSISILFAACTLNKHTHFMFAMFFFPFMRLL